MEVAGVLETSLDNLQARSLEAVSSLMEVVQEVALRDSLVPSQVISWAAESSQSHLRDTGRRVQVPLVCSAAF